MSKDMFGVPVCMYGCPETTFKPKYSPIEVINAIPKEENKRKFSLERAMAGDAVETVSGKPARIICFDRKARDKEYLVVLVMEKDIEHVWYYDKEGKYASQLRETNETAQEDIYGDEYELDLVMKPKVVTKWFCLYVHSKVIGGKGELQHKGPFDTKEEAERYNIKSINWRKLKVYSVDYEEV
jgi:hypothetical protein